jgi:hypothetical protein
MSLKAARARPRGSKAKATASTDVRKTSARIQTLESSRNFGGTLCDSKTALLAPLGYGSYMPGGCVLRMTWQFGSQLTKKAIAQVRAVCSPLHGVNESDLDLTPTTESNCIQWWRQRRESA